jgi:hypothetical protein
LTGRILLEKIALSTVPVSGGSVADFWRQLLSYLGSFTVIVTAITYLFRTLLKQFLDRDLEKHKGQLAAERERVAAERVRDLETFRNQLLQSLESYKAQLQLANKEQEIRFAKLHEKRATFLAELYEQLEDLGTRTNQVTAFIMREGIQGQENEVREVLDQGTKLAIFFKRNKLYFSTELASQMESIIAKFSGPSDTNLFRALANDPSSYGQSVRHGVMAWRSEFSPIQEEALRTIEREFRVMLGSEAPCQQAEEGSAVGINPYSMNSSIPR